MSEGVQDDPVVELNRPQPGAAPRWLSLLYISHQYYIIYCINSINIIIILYIYYIIYYHYIFIRLY